MTEKERLSEWVRWVKISTPGYQVNALLAVLENDGEKMMTAVLKELGWMDSLSLLKGMAEKSWSQQ